MYSEQNTHEVWNNSESSEAAYLRATEHAFSINYTAYELQFVMKSLNTEIASPVSCTAKSSSQTTSSEMLRTDQSPVPQRGASDVIILHKGWTYSLIIPVAKYEITNSGIENNQIRDGLLFY